ncbi:MAG: Holliday junction resolvase RuvX [Gammaproteobacteria bacterium]|nr:Holliday junction resolvase RuvX [Gammaproteobacteria bacterium]
MPEPQTVLGFDYGLRRIGTAVGQTLTATATPGVTLIANQGKPDWQAISQLIDDWQPTALIVGLPLNMDDSEQQLTAAARRFGNQLHGRYQLPVYFADERLTSKEAACQLGFTPHSTKKRKLKRANVDSLAAKLIIETWFDTL